MDEPALYKRIAAEIRRQIHEGSLQPGDRLPAIRHLTREWNCTPGTVQHAYAELASEGLVSGQAGRGTRVSQARPGSPALRRARLVHRAEAFILEALTAGQGIDEIEQAVMMALDRWRVQQKAVSHPASPGVLRFAGSHDMAIAWIAAHIGDDLPGMHMEVAFSGSLGGLITLAEGKCDLAGCHLLDAASGEYNIPYLRRLFPGRQVALVNLARRSIGLMVSPGNPLGIQDIGSLAKPGVRFINRQAGSGTRVYLDECLQRLGLPREQIIGYANEVSTHSQAALAVADGQADAALGLESAAAACQLSFLPLVSESYDLAALAGYPSGGAIDQFFAWLALPAVRESLAYLPGYDFSTCGMLRLLDL